MAINVKELQKSEFWQRKIRTLAHVRDTNRDGVITAADYELVIQRYKEMGASKDHILKLETIYAKILQSSGLEDKTKALTYEQFVASYVRVGEEVRDPEAVFMTHFEIVDSDGNGEISFKEWQEHYAAVGINTKYARGSFDAMDTNKDGIVSKEEYVPYAKEFFTSAEDKLNSSILCGPLVD